MVRTGVRAKCSLGSGRSAGGVGSRVAVGPGLVHAGVAEVTATDPRSLPTAALADGLRGMEAAAAAPDATRALVLGAFDARGGGHDDGANTTVSWLRGPLPVSLDARRVRVARALPMLPLVAAALGGEISHSHAEVITGLARGGAEAPPRALTPFEDQLVAAAPGPDPTGRSTPDPSAPTPPSPSPTPADRPRFALGGLADAGGRHTPWPYG